MARSHRVGRVFGALLGAATIVSMLGAPALAADNPTASAAGSAAMQTGPATNAKSTQAVPADAVNLAMGPRIVDKPAASAGSDIQVSPFVTWTVSLTATPTTLFPGQYSQLKATANQSVTQTGEWISVYDNTVGQYVAICGSGNTCTGSVTKASATSDTFVAYVSAKPLPPTAPPPSLKATSTTVTVTWQSIAVTLAAAPTTTGVSTSTTLTATTSADVGLTNSYIEIFKVTDTSAPVLVGSPCGSGTTCTATVTEAVADTDSFVAYVADYTTSYPPTSGVLATSNTSWVSWSDAGFTVSLAMTTGTATATVTPPATPPTYFVEIFDETTGGAPVATCGPSVTTCTATTTVGDHYVAFVSSPSADTALPPTNAVASSNIGTGV